MNLGGAELLIVVIIAVVIFGGGWLPKAARNLGRAKVEVDKAQKQLAETKAQVIEATGLDKADEALRKANRALNTSPQGMMRNAAKSALAGPVTAGQSGDAVEIDDTTQTSGDDADSVDETVNLDFTDD